MKRSKKTDRVYTALKKAVSRRDYLPNTLLPKEVLLAEQYGISRVTLRRVLARLEEESLIRRVRGYGTYVCDRKERKRIIFLLPCPESVANYLRVLIETMQGVIYAADEYRCDLEMVTVSPTNDNRDIDFSRLDCISQGSYVVVCSFWFSTLFPFLQKTGCKTVVIHDRQPPKYSYLKYLRHWHSVALEKRHLQMGKVLYSLGCRKPLCLMEFVKNPEFTFAADMEKFCREHAMKPDIIDFNLNDINEKDWEAKLQKLIRENNYDGALVNHGIPFRLIRKLAPNIPCGVFDYKEIKRDSGELKPAFYSDFDHMQVGRKAVELLVSDSETPLRTSFEPDIVISEEYKKLLEKH